MNASKGMKVDRLVALLQDAKLNRIKPAPHIRFYLLEFKGESNGLIAIDKGKVNFERNTHKIIIEEKKLIIDLTVPDPKKNQLDTSKLKDLEHDILAEIRHVKGCKHSDFTVWVYAENNSGGSKSYRVYETEPIILQDKSQQYNTSSQADLFLFLYPYNQ